MRKSRDPKRTWSRVKSTYLRQNFREHTHSEKHYSINWKILRTSTVYTVNSDKSVSQFGSTCYTLLVQQDRCLVHYARQVRTYLDKMYPNQWIDHHGPIKWPARSPDLALNDFYL